MQEDNIIVFGDTAAIPLLVSCQAHVMNHAPSKRRVTICRIIAAPLMPKPYPPHGHQMFSGRFSCEETGTEYTPGMAGAGEARIAVKNRAPVRRIEHLPERIRPQTDHFAPIIMDQSASFFFLSAEPIRFKQIMLHIGIAGADHPRKLFHLRKGAFSLRRIENTGKNRPYLGRLGNLAGCAGHYDSVYGVHGMTADRFSANIGVPCGISLRLPVRRADVPVQQGFGVRTDRCKVPRYLFRVPHSDPQKTSSPGLFSKYSHPAENAGTVPPDARQAGKILLRFPVFRKPCNAPEAGQGKSRE